MPCNCCEITDKTFGEDSARADIKSYRKNGPAKQTRFLLQAIRALKIKDADLLGIPVQVVVGDRGLESDKIEFKIRRTGEKLELSKSELVNKVLEFYK